ncbi:MAG: DUF1801 domain-containing protein [Patescibacteria group bacterium]
MPISSNKKVETVSEYINQAPKDAQKKLREMRAILKSVSPKAIESIKWRVPAFSYERILYAYAGFKHHIGFYPTPAAMKAFEKDLEKYKTGKGSINFPLDKPLPKMLIQKIAKFRIKDLKENDARWM